MTKTVIQAKHFKDEVWWQFEVNGVKYRAVKKKNKFGEVLEKTYVYTNSDGYAYYSSTALAVFSQKHFLEKMLNVDLVINEQGVFVR